MNNLEHKIKAQLRLKTLIFLKDCLNLVIAELGSDSLRIEYISKDRINGSFAQKITRYGEIKKDMSVEEFLELDIKQLQSIGECFYPIVLINNKRFELNSFLYDTIDENTVDILNEKVGRLKIEEVNSNEDLYEDMYFE